MLKPRSLQNHKRRQSQIQLFYPQRDIKKFQSIDSHNKNKQKSIKNNKKVTSNNSKKSNTIQKQKQKQKNRILKLISTSTDKIKQKNVVIENIDYQNNQNVNTMNRQNFNRINNDNEYDIQSNDNYKNNYSNYVQNQPFFQFGRRSRRQLEYQSSNNNQIQTNFPLNLIINNNLNMQQIVQVPDTMSNQRRYDTSNNIQMQNSLLKNIMLNNIINSHNNNENRKNISNNNSNNNSLSFSKKLQQRNNYNTNNINFNDNFYEFKQQDTHEQTLQPLKSLSKILTQQSKQKIKQNNTKKTLKQRKNKQPNKQYSCKQIQTTNFNNNMLPYDKFDISQIMTLHKKNNKKSKQLIVCHNNQSMSKSKILKIDKQYYSKSNKSNNNSVNKSKSKGKLTDQKLKFNDNFKNIQNKLKAYSQVSLGSKNQNKKSLSLSLKCKNNTNSCQNGQIKAKSSQKIFFNNNFTNNSNRINDNNIKPIHITNKSQYFRPLLKNNLSSNTANITKKIMLIQQSQSKLHNQYKVLWQCIGQLWENSRITRYISEKNKSQILKIKENQNIIDQKVIKMKGEIIKEISSARY